MAVLPQILKSLSVVATADERQSDEQVR